jgi:hypothetical protein
MKRVEPKNAKKGSAKTESGKANDSMANAAPEIAAEARRPRAARTSRRGRRPAYRVSVRGAIPLNLVQRISEAHASAELQSRRSANCRKPPDMARPNSLNSNQLNNKKEVEDEIP